MYKRQGINSVLIFVQVFFAVIVGLYFWNLLKAQRGTKNVVEKKSCKELEDVYKRQA